MNNMGNPSDAAKYYRANAAPAASKLVEKFVGRTDKLAKASSDAAEANYSAGVQRAAAKKLRQKSLRKITEDDMNRGMLAKGANAYSAGVTAGADKYEKNVTPFLAEQNRIMSSPEFKARGQDVAANVMGRVVPLAKGLRDLKERA